MKKVIAVALLTVMICSLCACSGGKSEIVGTWTNTHDSRFDGRLYDGLGWIHVGDTIKSVFVFERDGKGKVFHENLTQNEQSEEKTVFWRYDKKENTVWYHDQGSTQEAHLIYENGILYSGSFEYYRGQ